MVDRGKFKVHKVARKLCGILSMSTTKVTGVNICYLDQFSNFAVVFIVGFWLKPNFLLRKIFRGNLKEAISLAEIASFRFPWKISLKREVAIMSRTAIVWKRRGLINFFEELFFILVTTPGSYTRDQSLSGSRKYNLQNL